MNRQTARPRDTLGVLLVVASAFAYGTVPIFAKTAFREGVTLSTFLTLRFALAAALLWAVVPITGGRLPRAGDAVRLVLMGAVGYCGQSAAFFFALARLPASTTALVLYTYPAIVTLTAAAVLHDRLTARKVVAVAIAFGGTALVVRGQSGGADPRGIALALTSAAIYSAYILFGSRLFVGVPPIASAATILSGTAVAYAAFGSLAGGITMPTASAQAVTIAVVAVIGTAVPVLAFLAGMPRIGAARASILSTFEPAVTVLLAAAVLGEPLRFAQIAGAACVIASVVVLESGRPVEPAPL